jgi:predicted secreted protein
MSHCLLNCNAKYPGSADTAGVYMDLFRPIADQDMGIEQMPCLEIMGWGGVDRPLVLFKLDPEKKDADWIQSYPKLCQQEAMKVVDQIEDYINCGIEVAGVIYVSDSPTCGLTDTLAFPDVHFQIMSMDIVPEKLFDYEYKRNHIWPYLKSDGKGAFIYPMYIEIRRRRLPVPFIPFKPSNPRRIEIERILGALGLS